MSRTMEGYRWAVLFLSAFFGGLAVGLAYDWHATHLHTATGIHAVKRPYAAISLARPQQQRTMATPPSVQGRAAAVPRMPTALSHPASLTPPATITHGPLGAVGQILGNLQTFAMTLGTALLVGCIGAFSAVKPTENIALLSTSGEARQTPPARNSWMRILFRLVADIALWTVAYLWFFKSVSFVEMLANHNPALQVPTYIALSLLPLFCLKKQIFEPSITNALQTLGALSGSAVLKHSLLSAIKPIDWLIKSVLVFFSSNLLVGAIPETFSINLPEQWKFLDPNGDLVLTAAEMRFDFQYFSTNLLKCIIVTLFGSYIYAVKSTPLDHEEPVSRKPNFVERYWTALKRGRGPPLVLDLVLSIIITAGVVLRWMRFFNIKPEAVLAFGGVGGIAIGLASQTVVGNLVSGLLLLVTQPFAVGDEISTGKRQGIVKQIGWSSTVVQEKDGSLVLIPNRSIVGQETVNLSVCSVRVLELKLPVTIPGGAEQCKPMLKSAETLIENLPALNKLLKERPRAFFGYSMTTRTPTPVITIEATVDGSRVNTEHLQELKSEVFIALADHLRSEGVMVTGIGSNNF